MINDGSFLALDLEMNQPSGKIIQVGIAIGDVDMRYDDYFVKSWYIDPKEEISSFITQLTGISSSTIRGEAFSHEYVARELSAVINQYKPFINPVVWGHNDSDDLSKEFSQNNVDFGHFGQRCIYVKTWHTYLMLSRAKSVGGSLKDACASHDINFIGLEHRADVDAKNTLALFFKLLRRQSSMESMALIGKEI
jgi:inhibitor of KinA sporulation pathway (predicted exonuclease)